MSGTAGRLRVDANGGWTVAEACERSARCSRFGLEYVEQPCATVAELAELRSKLGGEGVLIAADESVRKASDPLAVARAGAADLLVIKAQPLGGIRSAMRIVADAGLAAVVSSALDTSVGIAMGAHLAAQLPSLDFDCGLGTAALLAADVTDEPLLPVAGAIPVRRVQVSEALLRPACGKRRAHGVVAAAAGAVLRGARRTALAVSRRRIQASTAGRDAQVTARSRCAAP